MRSVTPEQLHVWAIEKLTRSISTLGKIDIVGDGFTLQRQDPDYPDVAAELFPITSAGTVVVCPNYDRVASVLLVNELSEKGKRWDIPSGGVETGDQSPLATALRELREETGLVIKSGIEPFPLNYSINYHKQTAALQYLLILPEMPELTLQYFDGKRYYYQPNGSGEDVIQLALEPFAVFIDPVETLLNHTNHSWAYTSTVGAIIEKVALAQQAN